MLTLLGLFFLGWMFFYHSPVWEAIYPNVSRIDLIFDSSGGQAYIPVTVDDQSLELLVDTGATNSAFPPDILAAIADKTLVGEVEVAYADGRTEQVRRFTVARMIIGTCVLTDVAVVEAPVENPMLGTKTLRRMRPYAITDVAVIVTCPRGSPGAKGAP